MSLWARVALVLSAATTVGSFSAEAPAAKAKAWFPVRPADALPTDYDSVVRGAFVRHVVVETAEMADLGLQTYLKGRMVDSSQLSARVSWAKNPNRASQIHIRSAIKKSELRSRHRSAEEFLINIKKSI